MTAQIRQIVESCAVCNSIWQVPTWTMSCNDQLTTFPNLNDSEFGKACSALQQRFELHAHNQSEWTAVETISQHGASFLRLTKPLLLQPAIAEDTNEIEELELNEKDDEVAALAPSIRAAIYYDIVLSPSYRVPVLYFTIADSQHRYPPTIETLYTHIVPPAFRSQAEHVGVIGGITVTDHPATSKPVFFIHPCRTAEIMEASTGGANVTAYEYLLVWIGALGKCVGLNVPFSLVGPSPGT